MDATDVEPLARRSAELAILVEINVLKFKALPNLLPEGEREPESKMHFQEVVIVRGGQHHDRDAVVIAAIVRPLLSHQIPISEELRPPVVQEPAAQIDEVGALLVKSPHHVAHVIGRVIVVVIEMNNDIASSLLDQQVALFSDREFLVCVLIEYPCARFLEVKRRFGAVIKDMPFDIRVILAANTFYRILQEAMSTAGGSDNADQSDLDP